METSLYHGDKKVIIREFDKERDLQVVEKLEGELEIGSRKGFSIITNMMGDPLCRVRHYPNHIMLLAELVTQGESLTVGVVRGCIKCVGAGQGAGQLRMGCILGLRVSAKHRRMGIGTRLVKAIEAWAIKNRAQYLFAATDENNISSVNLFSRKCDYTRLTSLSMVIQPIDTNCKIGNHVKIQKLTMEQATSLYKDRLGGTKLFPVDINAILSEKLNLGTWVAYLKEEKCSHGEEYTFIGDTPSSWAMLSMWKTCECYKLQIKVAPLVRCFHATLGLIGSKILPMLKVFPSLDLVSSTPFGFMFLYGLYGEGEREGDLIGSLWNFACNLGCTLEDCKAIVAEFGANDPTKSSVPWGSSTSCIDDVWFLKRVTGINGNELFSADSLSRIFVDPRDF